MAKKVIFYLNQFFGGIGGFRLAATFLGRIPFGGTFGLKDLCDAIVKIAKVGVGNVERLNERYYLLKWHIIQFFCGMHSNIKVGK